MPLSIELEERPDDDELFKGLLDVFWALRTFVELGNKSARISSAAWFISSAAWSCEFSYKTYFSGILMKLNKTILIRVTEKNSKGKTGIFMSKFSSKNPLYFSMDPQNLHKWEWRYTWAVHTCAHRPTIEQVTTRFRDFWSDNNSEHSYPPFDLKLNTLARVDIIYTRISTKLLVSETDHHMVKYSSLVNSKLFYLRSISSPYHNCSNDSGWISMAGNDLNQNE